MKHGFACAAFVAAIFSSTSTFAEGWEVTKLVPGSAFHGVHGLGIDKAGHLFAGSVAGAAVYEVDIAGGTAKIAIPAPVGMADDIAFAPDGTMAWTGFLAGDLYSRKVTEIAANLPIGLEGAPGGLPSNIPTGVAVGASGVIYFSSDIGNAIYKVAKK